MSYEVVSETESLGQFASNNGYATLIGASEKDPVLSKFFEEGETSDVPPVIQSLKALRGSAEVESTAKALAKLLEDAKAKEAIITQGFGAGEETEKADKPKCPYCSSSRYSLMPTDFETARCAECGKTWDHGIVPGVNDPHGKRDGVEIYGNVVKVDAAKHLVFGWFSIVQVDGRPVQDTQGDIITPSTIEDSAYHFVLNARTGGHMHEKDDYDQIVGIGRLVESVVLTKEKQSAMIGSLNAQGIQATMDLHCEAWWGGFYVENSEVWNKIATGELRAWSIGGKGKRAALET